MQPLTWIATNTPFVPSPSPSVNPDTVTPGVAGFIAIAVIALAVVFLLIDMIRRIRRGRYRAEIAEQLDAEEAEEAAARAAEEAAAVDGDATGDDVTPEGPAKG